VVDSGQQSLFSLANISYGPVPWHTNKRRSIGPGYVSDLPFIFPLLLPHYSPSSNSCEFRGKGGQSIVLKCLSIVFFKCSVKWQFKILKNPIVWDLKYTSIFTFSYMVEPNREI